MDREEELLQLIKDLKKERKKWTNRIWNQKNKERVKEYKKNYNKINKESIKKRQDLYRKINEKAIKKQEKLYRERNKDKIKKREQDNYNTIERKKVTKKSHWKLKGLNMENFEEVWKRYDETTNCDLCNVVLTIGKVNSATSKHMDHSHITGEFRNILCQTCNVRRGENNL